jgi:hypothetical protein
MTEWTGEQMTEQGSIVSRDCGLVLDKCKSEIGKLLKKSGMIIFPQWTDILAYW